MEGNEQGTKSIGILREKQLSQSIRMWWQQVTDRESCSLFLHFHHSCPPTLAFIWNFFYMNAHFNSLSYLWLLYSVRNECVGLFIFEHVCVCFRVTALQSHWSCSPVKADASELPKSFPSFALNQQEWQGGLLLGAIYKCKETSELCNFWAVFFLIWQQDKNC